MWQLQFYAKFHQNLRRHVSNGSHCCLCCRGDFNICFCHCWNDRWFFQIRQWSVVSFLPQKKAQLICFVFSLSAFIRGSCTIDTGKCRPTMLGDRTDVWLRYCCCWLIEMGSTIDGIHFLFTVNVRVNGFIDSIIDPITDLNDEFGVIVDAVEEQLGSTQQIEDEMVNLETRFKQLESTSYNYKDWPNCDSLELISVAAGKASEATVASAKVFTDDLGAVTDSITENLLAAKGSISAATQSSQDSADDMKKVVADALTETSKQALSAANQISDHQGKISGGPFAWVRVCLFLFDVDCIVVCS